MTRIVVTGVGMVTPLGLDKQSTWESLLAGKSGAGAVSLFDVEPFPATIACEVKGFDASTFMNPKEVRQTDRYIQFAMAAANEARQGIRP